MTYDFDEKDLLMQGIWKKDWVELNYGPTGWLNLLIMKGLWVGSLQDLRDAVQVLSGLDGLPEKTASWRTVGEGIAWYRWYEAMCWVATGEGDSDENTVQVQGYSEDTETEMYLAE